MVLGGLGVAVRIGVEYHLQLAIYHMCGGQLRSHGGSGAARQRFTIRSTSTLYSCSDLTGKICWLVSG